MTDPTPPSTASSETPAAGAPVDPGDDPGRVIELDIEVPGTPEQVWRAIATGPGISSWYVSHEVEEREGGELQLSFGPGMDATGRVAVWDPPHRVVFDNGETVGLAFEWIIEARDGGSCVVRLVNSGFGSGEEWDAQYDGMRDGWVIFLHNLRLHLEHFAGQSATPSIPMAVWEGPRERAWERLVTDLGVTPSPVVGERLEVTADDAPPLGGTIAMVADDHVALVVDSPAPGTAFLAAEEQGGAVSVSVWSYLYGDAGAAAVERDAPAWRAWLDARAVTES